MEDGQHFVRFARTSAGPVHAAEIQAAKQSSNASWRQRFECYDCKSELIFRQQHKRKRNGVSFDVKACFAHKSTSTCNGESVAHKAGKHAAVMTVHTMRYYYSCCTCGSHVDVDLRGEDEYVEFTASEEVPWESYVLDVAVTKCEAGKQVVVGAVEICHTHACEDEKLLDMTAGGLAWVEVDAHAMVRASHLPAAQQSIEVLKCAHSKCPACIDAEAAEEQRRLTQYRDRYRVDVLVKTRERDAVKARFQALESELVELNDKLIELQTESASRRTANLAMEAQRNQLAVPVKQLETRKRNDDMVRDIVQEARKRAAYGALMETFQKNWDNRVDLDRCGGCNGVGVGVVTAADGLCDHCRRTGAWCMTDDFDALVMYKKVRGTKVE